MSVHIGAKKGEIAETVLLPGDPLRAKYVADNFLTDVVQYNNVRGMLGFTGNYNGKRISVQGSGMGVPSISIYAHELVNEYDVKNLIRIGSCGALQPDIGLRDIILAMSASTNSAINRRTFKGMDFAPCANFDLLKAAAEKAAEKKIPVKVGSILASDTFYENDPEEWKLWAKFGVLAVEMESSALYTIAARFGIKALSILTVSDSLVNQQFLSSEDRQNSFIQMMEIALEIA